MDDERALPGVPELDRQSRPVRFDARGRSARPNRVPEARPTPLQGAFIYLSIVVLVCGVVAITALELGATLQAPVVRVPVVLGALVLAVLTLDALLRVSRSARVWLRVDPGRAAFRVVWVAVLLAILVLVAAALWLVLTA